MFLHNFKYALKTLFKNKTLIFWTFVFPIILGTFFNMAFADIESNKKLDIINIAVVDNEQFKQNEYFKSVFKILGDDKNEHQLFDIRYVNENQAAKLLINGEITGYVFLDKEIKVVVKASGVNETILKYVTEEVTQWENVINTITEYKIQEEMQNHSIDGSDMELLLQKIHEDTLNLAANESKANIEDISGSHLSYTMIEFYTLIAMTCLYGGILGLTALKQNLANMSSNGKRVSISPTSKFTLIFSSVLASYIVQLIGIILLFIYTSVVLKVDYGNHFILIIFLTMAGCLAGLSLGVGVATIFKANDNVKTGIILFITMVGSFLSGMMGITMKYIIDKNAPLINRLNPVNMITDGLYSLYYYDTFDRYWLNLTSLLIFSIVMISISLLSLRRQKYDSI